MVEQPAQLEKVTFAQAAAVLNLHPNTLKNWQKAGKLATAEKRKVKGVITWLVDLDEVTAINDTIVDGVIQRNQNYYQQPQQNEPETAEQTPPEQPAQATQTTQIQPNIEATLAIFRESVVAPLTALIKEQGNQIGELREEVGTLKERLRNAEAQLEAARLAAAVQESAKPVEPPTAPPQVYNLPQPPTGPEPSPILNRTTLEPITTENRKSFWQRLFGG